MIDVTLFISFHCWNCYIYIAFYAEQGKEGTESRFTNIYKIRMQIWNGINALIFCHLKSSCPFQLRNEGWIFSVCLLFNVYDIILRVIEI